MKRGSLTAFVCLLALSSCVWSQSSDLAFRAPAVPLVACDPYFSVWSFADALTDTGTVHWTGRSQALTSLIRVDGQTYRLMGREPESLPALPQTRVQVLPTRTIYTFEGAGVRVTLTFMQAALPDDIDLLSRPVVYLNWTCASLERTSHEVSVYYDNTAEIAVNDPAQTVTWSEPEISQLTVLSTGTDTQPVLRRKGDNVRIDWGYFYVAAKQEAACTSALAPAEVSRTGFAGQGRLPKVRAGNMPCVVNDGAPVLAMQFDLGKVGRRAKACQVVLAYDDLFSVKYFGKPLRPYWRRNGADAADLLTQAVQDYRKLESRCIAFDKALMADLTAMGGEKYALMAALAYRQCVAANKIVADDNGMPLMFSKENFSNGCMGTADVFYPMAPQFLLLNPGLIKATVVPMLDYAASDHWPFPFSPHDLGTYPDAGKQSYGGGERSEENQMPVEECGNMLLLMTAIAQAEGTAELSGRYWPLLTQWAEYLRDKGLDPENQLCTDDFAGHLAHNVNLSVKAILGMAGYGKLAGMLGKDDVAKEYHDLAAQFAGQWATMAREGDHYRLAFDRQGTWSQKYNLVWDRLLDLDIFDDSIAETEMAYYRKIQKPFGLPLDNRTNYTKLDWIFWTASITGDREDFDALIAPVYRFLNETPDRVPMTDWYWTHNAKHRGFQARPVVGGVFIRMMENRTLWKKWVKKSEKVTGQWAVLPKPPVVKSVMPTARDEAITWSYTLDEPQGEWFQADYDDSAW
ncbi:MAG: DUF4965 domain-containing protein, partial [Phycisphaerae bacterium]|nr:DUF4965 domain-containing protein [Phycisphaerae bacterium]